MVSLKVFHLVLVVLLSGFSKAAPAPSSTAVTAPNPQSTACGDIVNNEETFIFNASLAYECLTSVPFNPAVATRFIKYFKDTLQFQSTLTYLKNPPGGYQQPGVDLMGGLNQLQDGINRGIFPNQYEFEAALQTLLIAAHDGHTDLTAGILSAFSFASPHDIVTLSVDGTQLPKVYLADDLFDSSYFTTYQPSAVTSINGQDTVTYLTDFANKNSVGTLEPHADWNQLMLSAAQDIQGVFDVFSGSGIFYPGDTVTFGFENGTSITDKFLALYNSPGPTGPLQTGGDFYNFFVLGIYPPSFFEEDDDSSDPAATSSAATPTSSAEPSSVTSSAASTNTNWVSIAYPDDPDVFQEDLGEFGGGYVSGYFLKSTSTSVLSIPSFDEQGDAIGTFKDTIAEFITKTKAAGLTKIVIDLQQNLGGQPLLAFDTFRQFFPNINPFGGSRLRAHPLVDLMGETITGYWESLSTDNDDYSYLAADEFVATDRINANTGKNFTSWPEFFGPNAFDGDNFTTTQQYNLSSPVFLASSTLGDDPTFGVFGFGRDTATYTSPPFAAENIIILSDGICSSSCAIFMEMMRHEAKVRTVVVGGRPSTGPMQAPSGSRGARSLSIDTLDANINVAQFLLTNQSLPQAAQLPNRTEERSIFVAYGTINLRDQVRKGETIPLQFEYEPADCRIFYTPQTVYNYTALWQMAADSIWTKPSLCVAGSTGKITTGQIINSFINSPPASPPIPPFNLTAYLTPLNIASSSQYTALNDGLTAQDHSNARGNLKGAPKPCTIDADCNYQKSFCRTIPSCDGGPSTKQCVDGCTPSTSQSTGNGMTCTGKFTGVGSCNKQNITSVKVGYTNAWPGFCMPSTSSQPCGKKSGSDLGGVYFPG